MWEWLTRTTPTEVVTLIWVCFWGVMKLGEWKRSLEARRAPPPADADADPDEAHDVRFVTHRQMASQSAKDRESARQLARDVITIDKDTFVTKEKFELLLERHTAECRNDARQIVVTELGRVLERLTAVEGDQRKNRDWLIEIQSELGIRRRDRT